MAQFPYHHRIQANFPYNPAMVHNAPSDPRLRPFDELIWHGYDDEGCCVYRRNNCTGEVVRIDF